MRTFTVHAADTEAALSSGRERLHFVPEGTARWALPSPVLWFLYHRLWWEAAVYFGLSVLLALGAEALGLGASLILVPTALLQVLVAMEANDLRRLALSKKGYRPIALVHGRDEAEAELRFFANWTGPLPSGIPTDSDAWATSAVLDRRGKQGGSDPASSHPVWPRQKGDTLSPPPADQAAPDILGIFPKPHPPG